MFKKAMSILLAVSFIFCCTPTISLAFSKDTSAKLDNGAIIIGNNVTVNHLLEQTKFTARQGHGFAAEVANNFYDRIHGLDSSVVGNDNLKNGPDRLILNRGKTPILIQDKYYSSASGSIDACFENGMFRYIDGNGKPMQIEVPADQYDDAVRLLEKRISNGQLKNYEITDPAEAKNYVRKGAYTYKQACNLAKAGNIDSLKFDAQRGIVSATSAFGISALITYTLNRMDGANRESALKACALEGFKSGSIVFGASVISSQLARTSAVNVFTPSAEAIVNVLGDKFAKSVLTSVGKSVVDLADDSVRKEAAKVLSNQLLTNGVTIILLTVDDAVNIIRGRISAEQLLKNLAVTTAGVAGGYAGNVIGGAIGSAVAPGVGSAAGSVIGGIVIGGASGIAANQVLGIFIRDDAEEMMDILEKEFVTLSNDYFLNEEEAANIADSLQRELSGKLIKDMFASDDQALFAQELIEPLISREISNRTPIAAPSTAELRSTLKEQLKDIALIH